MPAIILKGDRIAAAITERVRERVDDLFESGQRQPWLHVVLTTSDHASRVYVERKKKLCKRSGIYCYVHEPFQNSKPDTDKLVSLVHEISEDGLVDGILVQLPLPPEIDRQAVFEAISPSKDVDCFHPTNMGRLWLGRPVFTPPTPQAVCDIIDEYGIPTKGKRVTIINRSEVVGKPLAGLLVQEDYDATVSVCHIHTPLEDTKAICRESDIIVVAVGKPGFLTADMVRPGASVIDVGINRTDAGIVGDVDFVKVSEVAGAITPVPGGVGPITVARVVSNTLVASLRNQSGKKEKAFPVRPHRPAVGE